MGASPVFWIITNSQFAISQSGNTVSISNINGFSVGINVGDSYSFTLIRDGDSGNINLVGTLSEFVVGPPKTIITFTNVQGLVPGSLSVVGTTLDFYKP
jgi:hypothetical protein